MQSRQQGSSRPTAAALARKCQQPRTVNCPPVMPFCYHAALNEGRCPPNMHIQSHLGHPVGGAAAASAPAGQSAEAAGAEAAAAPAAAQAPEEDEAAPVAGGAGGGQEAKEEEVIHQFVPGLLLRFDFGDATHDLSYEDIKAAFRPVAFVEFQKVRFSPWLGLRSSLAQCPGYTPVA